MHVTLHDLKRIREKRKNVTEHVLFEPENVRMRTPCYNYQCMYMYIHTYEYVGNVYIGVCSGSKFYSQIYKYVQVYFLLRYKVMACGLALPGHATPHHWHVTVQYRLREEVTHENHFNC